jgi:hypothetical protein
MKTASAQRIIAQQISMYSRCLGHQVKRQG